MKFLFLQSTQCFLYLAEFPVQDIAVPLLARYFQDNETRSLYVKREKFISAVYIDCKKMFHIPINFTFVFNDLFISVYICSSVRVDADADFTDVCVNSSAIESVNTRISITV